MLIHYRTIRHIVSLMVMMVSMGAKAGSDLDFSAYGILGVDHRNAFYDRVGQDSETIPMLRRLKGDLDYNPDNPWRVKLGLHYSLVDFDEGRDERRGVNDAYVRYQWPGRRRLQVGRMREPFSLERLTGFSRLPVTERSMVTSAFAPGRSLGVKYSAQSTHLTWAAGLFQETESDDSPRAITGRFTYAPLIEDSRTLHVGVSGSLRDLQNQDFQIRERPEVFRGATIVRSASFYADQSELLGMELAWQSNALGLSSEVMGQRTQRSDGKEWLYSGYYAQASYFLTGEQRPYRRGGFRDIRPLHPSGAWELVGRFSQLNLRDHQVGSRSAVGLVGVNYYLGKDLSVKLHYLRSQISGNTLHGEDTGNAVIFRLQYMLL